MCKTIDQIWFDVFSKEELDSILRAERKHISHPLRHILNADLYTREHQVLANTSCALNIVQRADADWIKKNKQRLLEMEDYSTVDSALSELRTYGYLIESGFMVRPIPTEKQQTPDFIIRNSVTQVEYKIEVHSKSMSEEERDALIAFHEQKPPKDYRGRIWTNVHSTVPFGKADPAKDESITENAISKICATKMESNQLTGNNVSILWLDFQSEIHLGFSIDQMQPLNVFNGSFTSGALWYAFYGRKGFPIYEGSYPMRYTVMKHEGKFFLPNAPDYVFISLPRDLLLLENPNSKRKMDADTLDRFLCSKWLNIGLSCISFGNAALSSKIDANCNVIFGFRDLYEELEKEDDSSC